MHFLIFILNFGIEHEVTRKIMNGKISHRVISYLTEVLFGNNNIFALLVPAYKIQGEHLYHIAICPDYTKTLHNPDTLNSVYTCSLRKMMGGVIFRYSVIYATRRLALLGKNNFELFSLPACVPFSAGQAVTALTSV